MRELASPRATSLASSTAPRTPVTAPPLTTSSVDPVAEPQLHRAGVHGRPDPARERLDDPGAGAPHDVEAGHRVAGPGGGVAAALGPADDREEADALLLEPGPLLPRRELQVGLGPLPRPVVLVAVEARGAEPVLAGQFQRVVHPQPALLGRVDEEEPAERPPRLPAEGRRGLLVDQDHPLAGVGQFGRGDQTGQPGSHDDDIGAALRAHGPTLAGRPSPAPSLRRATRPSGRAPLPHGPSEGQHERHDGTHQQQDAGPHPRAAAQGSQEEQQGSIASSGRTAATARTAQPHRRPCSTMTDRAATATASSSGTRRNRSTAGSGSQSR